MVGIRDTDVVNIDVEELPLHRELLAYARMRRLLDRFPPVVAVALASTFRGFDRIIRNEDAVVFAWMVIISYEQIR